ncbi:MAG TPA: hypothetical protein VF896_14235 [Anaerolineales bacterium]
MYRRYREYRRHRRHYQNRPRRNFFTSMFRSPGTQIVVLLVVALIIFLILQSAGR